MARDNSLLATQLTPNVEVWSGLYLKKSDGTAEHYATRSMTLDGLTWLPMLRKVGDQKQNLFSATDKVTVTLSNGDADLGLDLASNVRAYSNALATTYRLYRKQNDTTIYKRVMYSGVVSSPKATVDQFTMDILDPMVAAGQVLASRPLSVLCPYRFKDGNTCQYAGVLTTCSKRPQSVDGCTGRANLAHYGGWQSAFASTPGPPSGGINPGGTGGGPGGDTCFVGNTMITMADGSQKEIRYVCPGERVMCFYYDPALNIDVVTSAVVEKVFHHDATEYFRFGFDDGRTNIGVTPEHPLYTGRGLFQPADYARLTQEFRVLDPIERVLVPRKLKLALWHTTEEPVYNLHVRKYHTYFANGVAVHNIKNNGDGIILIQ